MKKLLLIMTTLALTLIISACGKEEYVPQAINPDVDVCAVCKMAIKDDQYATQIITTDGQSIKFDDIGDLNVWKNDNGTERIGAAFVRDFYSLEWINYDDAVYVYDKELKTPMAFGIASFENKEGAEQFINEHNAGKLMTADELASHSWEVNNEHKHQNKHNKENMNEDMQSEHNANDKEMNNMDKSEVEAGGH